MMPRACVVGWPVAQSRSPMIHGYWLNAHGVVGAYDRVAAPPGGFPAFAATIGVDGLRGANVTAPHKEAAFAACDRLTDAARAIGAVNTLWREGNLLCGDNTDAEGFVLNLDEESPGWRREVGSALILGAGGAARAVAHALLAAGTPRVTLVNRTAERAAALCDALGPAAAFALWEDLPARMAETDMLVNTTSLGMVGRPALEIAVGDLPARAIVVDIVYVPLTTALLAEASRRGHRVVGGLGMLLHQAAPGFERWFGVRPEVTPALRALVEADILGPKVGA